MIQMLKKIFGLKKKKEIMLKTDSVYFDFFTDNAREVRVSILAAIKKIKNKEGNVKKAAVAHFEFYDAKGERVEVEGNSLAISSVVGMYRYLDLNIEEEVFTELTLNVGERVRFIRLGLRVWDKNFSIAIKEKPKVKLVKNEIFEIDKDAEEKNTGIEVYDYSPVERDKLKRKPKIFMIKVKEENFNRKGLVRVLSFVELKFSGSDRLRNSALVSFEYLDAHEKVLMPDEGLAISQAVGAYRYLEVSPGKVVETAVEITIPKGCEKIKISLMSWTNELDVYVKGSPLVDLIQEEGKERINVHDYIDEIVERSLTGKGLIFLYTTAPLMGHASLGLRPNRMAREYAKLGYSVVFFPFSRVPDNEIKYQNNIFQFNRDCVGQLLEKAALFKNLKVMFVCSSFPDTTAIAAVDFAKSYGWKTLYEVRDEMEEFNRVGYSVWYRSRLEAYMCHRVDRVTTVSPALRDKMIILGAEPGKTVVIPNAVEEGFIKKAEVTRRNRITGQGKAESVKVGYIGHLTPSWFDWPWVIEAARELPDTEFEIIGHGVPEGLPELTNLKILGPKTHDEFLEICNTWKVGLIPFKPSRLTKSVDPNKLFEYLAVGLSVVSSDMGSVNESPLTYVYKNKKELIEGIKDALVLDLNESDLSKIEKYISKATWKNRAKSTLNWVFS
ncbi:type 12 methyltransferase [Alcaligenes faecalis subsp. faecalis NCIB 8687]|nr:type 12 methyltransferase [Alcaligenes faecalis subsp. faecalis NCIB 8687]